MEEKRINETVVRGAGNIDDWYECRSTESNKSEFEYKYEEDADKMIVKKFKRRKDG